MKIRKISTKNKMEYLKVSTSPFIHQKESTGKLMLWVAIATIPGIVCQVYFFSSGTIYQILLSILTSLVSEASVLQLKKLPIIPNLKDNSALLTGLLLAISIPPLSPWWLVVLGSSISILIAKHTYGGLGQNPFNPAMVGYVILLISFPVQMTSWLPPVEFQLIHTNVLTNMQVIFTDHTVTGFNLDQLKLSLDGITHATPLDSVKINLLTHSINPTSQHSILQTSLMSNSWQLVNIAYLFSGIILIKYRVINWQIPLAFLITLISCSLFNWLIMSVHNVSPILHLFSGATMLGAFFIATDPVTATTTPRGHFIYGLIIGLLTWIIRTYGSYPDGVAFAVLLANITVPLIDHYNQPRVYGYK